MSVLRLIGCLAAGGLFVATGCADADGNKAGRDDEVVTLQMGTADQVYGSRAIPQIEQFADAVAELSDGELQIELVSYAAGEGPEFDQRVARLVVDGDLEMGLIPSRAWDTEGVMSLRAINAPFLVTSDELLADVVSSDLAVDMLAGLDAVGVVGLALLPEGLRHPFGLTGPIFGLDDYDGAVVRTPRSSTAEALFAALGATVSDDLPNASEHDVMESSYTDRVNLEAPIATGNVTLFAKANALVANTEAFEELSDEHRSILEQAAAATLEWAIANAPRDAEEASRWCAIDRTVVLASAADRAELEAAAAPVYEELEQDPLTARIIEAIRQRKSELDVAEPSPAECLGSMGAAVERDDLEEAVDGGDDRDGGHDDSGFPEGVYRFEITEDDIRSLGFDDPALITQYVGIYTWTFADGEWCWERRTTERVSTSDCGAYTVDGDTITYHPAAGPTDRFTWTVPAPDQLQFEPVGDLNDPSIAVALIRPWERIGDAD